MLCFFWDIKIRKNPKKHAGENGGGSLSILQGLGLRCPKEAKPLGFFGAHLSKSMAPRDQWGKPFPGWLGLGWFFGEVFLAKKPCWNGCFFFFGGGGGGGGVSCFYSFGEPLKTWTYAMLTCIVYHVILLYSWTSQTYVHDNVWLKT